jgi:quercetin dioxygenase-like cupin family protein
LLRGSLIIHLGDREYRLDEGDSLMFQCDVQHWSENDSSSPATALLVMAPPIF